jgi:hypothetical protein
MRIYTKLVQAGRYNVFDAQTHETVGVIAKSSVQVTDYPWHWSILDEMRDRARNRTFGVAETLQSATGRIERQYEPERKEGE